MDEGSRSHAPVEPSMSVRQNVSTPVGRVEPQPARRRSTNSPGVAGRRAGLVASPARIAVSRAAACSGLMPFHVDGVPFGGAPVSSVNAVAASAYTSDARPGPSVSSSGAANPGVPRRLAREPDTVDTPKSTSTMWPPRVSTRLAGFTSPWITGGSRVCRCVSASAASASQPTTLDGESPGRPLVCRTRPRSTPSTQSMTMT